MKKLLLSFTTFFCSFSIFAQVFNSPESAEWDTANNRWLVGKTGSGTVLVYAPSTNTCRLLPRA